MWCDKGLVLLGSLFGHYRDEELEKDLWLRGAVCERLLEEKGVC